MKTYTAVVWPPVPGSIGRRVAVDAENLAQARQLLERQHGMSNVDLHNEEDAGRPRWVTPACKLSLKQHREAPDVAEEATFVVLKRFGTKALPL